MNVSVIYTCISNSICGTELYGGKKLKIELTNYSLRDLVTDYRHNSSEREFVNIKFYFLPYTPNISSKDHSRLRVTE